MHRNATQAKLILEKMEKRHARARTPESGGAEWIERFTPWDLRELRKAIALLDTTDLRTRKDKGSKRKRAGKKRSHR